MSSDSLQMHEFQPHTKQQTTPSASDRGIAFKTRSPSACRECRRRKQKCSLTHPCSNCARRFPQPVCEYGASKIKRPRWASPPRREHSTQAGGGGLYSHLDMDSIHDAIIEVEGKVDLGVAVDDVSVYSMEDEPWAGDKPFVMRFRDKTGLLKQQTLIELVQFILQTRLRVANRIVQDEWEIDGMQLIRALHARNQPSHDISSFDDQIQRLPMAPTRMNKELVRTHLQLLSRFKVSLDGRPQPNNRFMKHWIPFSIQDRLVLHVILCTTASFLNETGLLPKTLLHIHRATVTKMLNEYISSPTLCTGDSAILAVTQLILTSWYWSSTEELHAHMSGFRKMIQLRGGCRDLGMEGCTSKIALLNDAVIALCHNTDPVIFGQPGFEYDDPFHAPLQVNFNSPLLFNCPPFLIPSSSLRLHKRTAEILDGTRVLMQAVYDLPEDAGIAKVHEVSSLAASLLSFLNQLPDQVLLESNGDRDNAPVFTGQKRKRVGGEDTIVSSKKSHGASLVTTRSSTEDPPDMVYVTVRLTAVVWARAILERLPTKDVCTEAEFIRIWSMAWAAGLDKWSSLSGIYAWMTIAIGPLCHTTIHARMVKTLTVTTFTYMGTENWHVASEIATVALKIQAWLRAGKESKPQGALSGAFGGEKGIETFGFAFKENTMDLPDHRYESQPHEEEDDDDDDEQSAWAS